MPISPARKADCRCRAEHLGQRRELQRFRPGPQPLRQGKTWASRHPSPLQLVAWPQTSHQLQTRRMWWSPHAEQVLGRNRRCHTRGGRAGSCCTDVPHHLAFRERQNLLAGYQTPGCLLFRCWRQHHHVLAQDARLSDCSAPVPAGPSGRLPDRLPLARAAAAAAARMVSLASHSGVGGAADATAPARGASQPHEAAASQVGPTHPTPRPRCLAQHWVSPSRCARLAATACPCVSSSHKNSISSCSLSVCSPPRHCNSPPGHCNSPPRQCNSPSLQAKKCCHAEHHTPFILDIACTHQDVLTWIS